MTRRLQRRDIVVALGGAVFGAAVAAIVAASIWPSSCASKAAGATPGSQSPSGTASSAPASVEPLDLPLRQNEILLPPSGPYVSGKLRLVPLRFTCGLSEVVGTHAEWLAQGQYCRIRFAIDNNDGFTRTFDVAKTTMTTTSGMSIKYSSDAQLIKRQPDKIASMGGHDRYEMDIYYDVPRDATVNGFTFSDSEGGPTVSIALPVRSWPFK